MSKYNRRIVYLSDPEWRKLTHIAKRHKSTVSATIRDMLREPIDGEMMAWEVTLPDFEGKFVHHIDGNGSNNDPDNLEIRDAP